jgi:spore coat polysaccharide biosynthesis protein SpsF (cytidylyltransferase family)
MKRLVVVQISSSDVDTEEKRKNLREYNSVLPLKASGLFDTIALLCPDLPGKDRVEAFAKEWGVEFYAGSILDVRQRIVDCVRKYRPNTAVQRAVFSNLS